MDLKHTQNFTNPQINTTSNIDESFLYEKNSEEENKQANLEKEYLKKYFNSNTEIEKETFFDEIIKLIKRSKIQIDTTKDLKWIDLVEITFLSQNYKKMIDLFIDHFGFIPEELYTKLIFVTKNSFEKASEIFNYIYDKEKSSKNQETIKSLRKARNLFLKYIFLDKKGKGDKPIKGICEVLKSKGAFSINPDTNGIFIKLSSSKEHSINSHIPYQEIEDELIIYLFENKFIDENTFLEIKSRKYSILNKQEELEKTTQLQIDLILKAFNIKGVNTIEEKIQAISQKIIESQKDVSLVIYNNGLIIPNIVYLNIAKTLPEKEAFFVLTNFAEQFSCLVTKEKFEQDNRSYLMGLKIKGSYNIRRKSANGDTRLYNAYKAINVALGLKIQKDSGFYTAKTTVDDAGLVLLHTFLGGKVSKTVLNPKKHLQKASALNLGNIGEIDKPTLENMEVFFHSMDIAAKSKKLLEENIKNNILDIKSNIGLIQDILALALNYYPKHYNGLSRLLKSIIIKEDLKSYNEFLLYSNLMFEKLKRGFEDFFESGQNLEFLLNSIEKRTLTFDQKFLEYMKSKNLPTYSYSEKLCKSGKTSVIVEIKTRSGNVGSTDYLTEVSAINAINLNMYNPLIVVSGGCKEVSSDGVSSLDIFSASVLNYAIEKGANLSIPGTQSGIGISFAEKLIEYEQSGKYIGTSSKLNVFAISPKNNMADNDIPDSDKFAPLPLVNHLYIPCSAGWGTNGIDIVDVGYFQVIEAAEQTYNRLDRSKSRIHIIGNGGLFTIAEAIASIKNGSKIVFVEGTGRFSDLMCAILNKDNMDGSLFIDLMGLKNNMGLNSILDKLYNMIKRYLPYESYEEIINKDLGSREEIKIIFDSTKNIDLSDTKTAFLQICENIPEGSSIKPKNIIYILYLLEFLKLIFSLENKPLFCKLKELDKFLLQQ